MIDILGLILRPFSWLFALAVYLRNFFYDQGLLLATRVERPVVSIGNLSVGGSGKTPITIWLVRELKRRGLAVGVISRGYRSRFEGGFAIVDPAVADACERYGDEPTLVANVTGVPVAVGRRKVEVAGQLIRIRPEVGLLVADDAFQHRQLKRNVDIVLIDVSEPLSLARPLPLGRWRETLFSLRRAQFVFFTKCNWASPEQLAHWRKVVLASGISSSHLKSFSFRVAEPRRLDEVVGQQPWQAFSAPVAVLCAVAKPESFLGALREKGLQVGLACTFRDHHSWSEGELIRVLADCARLRIRHVLMTDKDAVRLAHWRPNGIELYTVALEVEPMEGMDDFFKEITALAT